MAIIVSTNVSSLNAQRSLSVATRQLDNSYKNLSSGLRINSAKDDAAGLQISDRMISQINGLQQGNRNANDGISMLQVAEGALDQITQNLQRIRVLAIQSANGTNSTSERIALQEEVAQLSAEINRIAKNTSFGGNPLLDGEQDFIYNQYDTEGFKTIKPISQQHPADPTISCRDENHSSKRFSFQVGSNSYQTIDINLGIKTDKIYCNAGCRRTFPTTAFLSCDLNGLYFASGEPNTHQTRVIDRDEDPSERTTGFCIGDDGLVCLDVSTFEAAENVIKYSNGYIGIIDSMRSEMGAIMNRLESTISNQENVVENVSDSRSRIRDADYASETAKMAALNIMQQASTSILTQANTLPQIAMQLLGA